MLRVLIAEDEDMIRKGLVYTTDWLSMGCVVVAEASDGKDGYEKILECRPDVVITDICMPFMDGIEMIKKASEQVKFKSILLTSYADFEYARRAIEARVCEYILKPVDEEALAGIMKRLEEEIASARQVEHALEQAELEGGTMNLEYYMCPGPLGKSRSILPRRSVLRGFRRNWGSAPAISAGSSRR